MLDKILNTETNFPGFIKVVVKATTYDEMLNLFIMNKLLSDDRTSFTIDSTSIINVNRKNDNCIPMIKSNKIYRKIPLEGIEFIYEDTKCYAKLITKTTKHLVKDNNEMYDTIGDLILFFQTDDNGVFERLFKEANVWWVESIKNHKKNTKESICYYWDQWNWDILYKSVKRNWDSIYYSDKFINNVSKQIDNFFSEKTRSLYSRLGITYKKSFLFEGPPGTGKTSLIFGIAAKYDLNIACLQITNDMKTHNLILAMRKIPEKSILVIEDIDTVFNKREKADICMNINFSTLLNIIDGILKPQDNILIIFTSNFKNNLDGALKRPGRIDEIVTFEYANREQVYKMYKNYFTDSTDEDFEKFYKSIRTITNLTICVLQKVFLKYFDNYKVLPEKTNEIQECIKECKLYDEQLSLYN